MALEPELRFTIGSTFHELELVDSLIDVFLKHLEWDTDELPNLSLAVREAAANAVQHGNALEGNAPVVILCGVEDGYLVVEVFEGLTAEQAHTQRLLVRAEQAVRISLSQPLLNRGSMAMAELLDTHDINI